MKRGFDRAPPTRRLDRGQRLRGSDRAPPTRRPVRGQRLLGVAFALSLFALPSAAWSENDEGAVRAPARTTARIVRIDGPEAYVDLGRTDGAAAGTELILYRRVVALHPESGARLEDRFEIVTVPIAEAGAVLSRVRLPPDLAVQIKVGDEARLARLPLGVTPVSPVSPVDAEPGVPGEQTRTESAAPGPDYAAFRRAFGEASGASLEKRQSVWRGFLESHPDSDLAPLVRQEVEAIEAAEDASLPAPPPPPARPSMALVGPSTIVEGETARVVATSLDDRPPRQVFLHYRRPGAEVFRYQPMRPYGDGAYAGELPETMLIPPFIEWFVTATDASGAEHRVGTSRSHRTRVEPVPEPPSPIDRSRVNLAFQYVDFYRFRHLDAYTQVEGDFLYRTLYPLSVDGPWPQLYAIRVGFGAFHGVGGPANLVAESAESGSRQGIREVGFNFGYTELEFRFTESLALMGRGIVGIADQGLDYGGQGSLRIGPELGTNLVLGALNVGRLGQAWHLQLAWDTVPSVPMNASVEVTTWPVGGEDLGVRLLYEARYRFTPWVEVGGRVGYGLRNINHGGLTLGLGTVFSW